MSSKETTSSMLSRSQLALVVALLAATAFLIFWITPKQADEATGPLSGRPAFQQRLVAVGDLHGGWINLL